MSSFKINSTKLYFTNGQAKIRNSEGGGGSAPATPTGLSQTACDTNTGTPTISWNSVNDATSYVLEYVPNYSGCGGEPVGSWEVAYSGPNTSIDIDTPYPLDGWAHYRVKAVNGSGSSDWSSVICAECTIQG